MNYFLLGLLQINAVLHILVQKYVISSSFFPEEIWFHINATSCIFYLLRIGEKTDDIPLLSEKKLDFAKFLTILPNESFRSVTCSYFRYKFIILKW